MLVSVDLNVFISFPTTILLNVNFSHPSMCEYVDCWHRLFETPPHTKDAVIVDAAAPDTRIYAAHARWKQARHSRASAAAARKPLLTQCDIATTRGVHRATA